MFGHKQAESPAEGNHNRYLYLISEQGSQRVTLNRPKFKEVAIDKNQWKGHRQHRIR